MRLLSRLIALVGWGMVTACSFFPQSFQARQLQQERRVNLEPVDFVMAEQPDLSMAQSIAQQSQRLAPHQKLLLPLKFELAGTDFTGLNLARVDFNEAHLREANFTGAQLASADFSQCDLEQSNFWKAQASRANFENANLLYATLSDADLREANFSGAVLKQVVLARGQLEGANFRRAKLDRMTLQLIVRDHRGDANLLGCDLTGADLSRLDLTGMKLIGVDFTQANITKTIFDRSVLMGSVFYDVAIDGTEFRHADLQFSLIAPNRVNNPTFAHANFRGAEFKSMQWGTIGRNDWRSAHVVGAEYDINSDFDFDVAAQQAVLIPTPSMVSNAIPFDEQGLPPRKDPTHERQWLAALETQLSRLPEGKWLRIKEGTDFGGFDFRGRNLQRVLCLRCDFRITNFTGANLSRGFFPGSDFTGVSFKGATLIQTDFSEAHLKLAQFDEAVLFGARFSQSKLEGATFVRALATRAGFMGSALTQGSFDEASLVGVSFYQVRGEDVSFAHADLRQGSLMDVRLVHGDFSQARLRSVSMTRGNFEKSVFLGVIFPGGLYGVGDATLREATYDAQTQFPEGFDPIQKGMILVK